MAEIVLYRSVISLLPLAIAVVWGCTSPLFPTLYAQCFGKICLRFAMPGTGGLGTAAQLAMTCAYKPGAR